MRRSLSVLMVFAVALALSACASDKMLEIAHPPQAMSAPSTDKATVVFLRPSMFGGAIQASVFDISNPSDTESLVGIVSSGKKVAYQIPPGKRRFMVIGETADFLDAELAAGKTYFARVEARFGVWKARFVLVPVPATDPELKSELESCKWVENTDAAYTWARENLPSIRGKRADAFPEWERNQSRYMIKIADGQ